jgi:transcription antitermination factor NusG
MRCANVLWQTGSFVRILAGPYIGRQAVVIRADHNGVVVQAAIRSKSGETVLHQTHVAPDQLRPMTWTPP